MDPDPCTPPTRKAVERDVAALRDLGSEATWERIDSLCRSLAAELSKRPDRAAVLAEQDPPHPSYEVVMRRLRAGYRSRTNAS